MNFKSQARMLLLLAAILTAAFALPAQTRQVELSSAPNQAVLRNNSDYGFDVNYSVGELKIVEVQTKKGTFDELSIDGWGFSTEVGEPMLPMLRRTIAVPLGAEVRLTLNSQNMREMDSKVNKLKNRVIPAQEPISKSADPATIPFVVNEALYRRNEYISRDWVQVSELGIMRGVRVFALDFYPVEYNPVTNSIRVMDKLDVRVDFLNPDLGATEDLLAKTASWEFEQLYARTFFNWNTSSRTVLVRQPSKMVILCPVGYTGNIQSYVDWKTEQGFAVSVVTVGTNGNVANTTTAIKNYMQNLWNSATSSNPAPTYLIIIGDESGSISIVANTGATNSNHITDLTYVRLNGTDYMPEMYYGRFSVSTTTELANVINKTITYEKTQMSDLSYLGKTVLIAGVDSNWASTHGNGAVNYGSTRYFNSTNGITSNNYLYPESGNSAAQIRANANEGRGYIVYTAHGSQTSWHNPSFTVSHVNAMTNTGKYGVMVGNCCITNEFDYSSPCFGEAVIRKANAGGVAYIGGTNSTYWNEDYYWAVGYKTPINGSAPAYDSNKLGSYDAMFHTHGEAYSKWATTVGETVYSGNLAVQQSGSSRTNYYWEIYHIMGDPSLLPYLRVPTANPASYPTQITTGETSYAVTGAAPYTRVGLTMNGVIYGSGVTDASGNLTLTTNPFNTTGTAKLVLTAQNRITKIVNIPVASATLYPPRNLTATAGNGYVSLSWQAPSSGTPSSYRVYRNGSQRVTVSGLSYTDGSVVNGTTYSYYVVAVYSGGVSDPSNTVSATPFALGDNEAIIGNGTNSTSTNAGCPINLWYKSLHGQSVYTKAELNAAGVYGPINITKIGLNITGLPNQAMPNFVIRMGHTTATNVSNWISSGLTQVWRSSSYQPTATGWNLYTLSTPFLWNGSDNIVIDTAFGLISSYSQTGTVQYTSVSNGYRFVRSDSADQTGVYSGGSVTSYRPNLWLTLQPTGGGGGDLVIGNGTGSTATNAGCPINLWYKSLHGQAVYTKAELNAAGVVGPVNITKIGLNITGLPNQAMPNFVIRMGHTTATNASNWISSGLTQVWRSSSYLPTATGWNMYTLSTPFYWNGSDNIVIDTAFGLISSYSQTGTVQYTSITSGYRFVRSDSADQTSVYSGGSVTSYRPNLKLALQSSGGGGDFIVGNGTGSTATNAGCPINLWYKSLHGQAVYTKAELNAAGVVGPINITQIGLNITGLPNQAMPNFVIRMGHTTATNASSWISSGLTQVWRSTSYLPTATGWNMYTLSTPFYWNGRDNIVIDTAFGLISSYSQTGTVQYTSITSGYRFVRSDSADQTGVYSGGSITSLRPNLKLALQASGGGGEFVIGTGTGSTPDNAACPVNIYYKSLHGQSVYTKAELNAAGLYGPISITKIGFNITGLPDQSMPNFVIRMGHTSYTDALYWVTSGLTQVWRSSSYRPTATGWNMYTLSTPFYWNGTDNIVVDTAFGLTGSWSRTGTVQYTSVTNGYGYLRSDSADQTNNFNGGYTTEYRPNLKLVAASSKSGPLIVVDTSTLSYPRVVAGNTEVKTFTIQNTGNEPLTFNIGVDQLASDLKKSIAGNATKGDVKASGLSSDVQTAGLAPAVWLSVEPLSGCIAAGESATITAYCSTDGMTEGTYAALLTIHSNDPESPNLNVNASLDVAANETIKLETPVISGLTKIDGGFRITWKLVENADSYEVWRSTDPKGTFKLIASEIKDLHFDDLTELPRAFYYLKAIKY